MKPSPQEAAKTDWAERWARKFFEKAAPNSPVSTVAIQILADGFFEADKNGCERGRGEHFQCRQWMQVADHQGKQDEALLRECFEALKDAHEFMSGPCTSECYFLLLIERVQERLAPSGKEK